VRLKLTGISARLLGGDGRVGNAMSEETPTPAGSIQMPPKPEKLAIAGVITAIKLGVEIGLPVATTLIPMLRSGGGGSIAAALLKLKEAELFRRNQDVEVEAIMADTAIPPSVKYCLKSLIEQILDARLTMALCAEILGDKK